MLVTYLLLNVRGYLCLMKEKSDFLKESKSKVSKRMPLSKKNNYNGFAELMMVVKYMPLIRVFYL